MSNSSTFLGALEDSDFGGNTIFLKLEPQRDFANKCMQLSGCGNYTLTTKKLSITYLIWVLV